MELKVSKTSFNLRSLAVRLPPSFRRSNCCRLFLLDNRHWSGIIDFPLMLPYLHLSFEGEVIFKAVGFKPVACHSRRLVKAHNKSIVCEVPTCVRPVDVLCKFALTSQVRRGQIWNKKDEESWSQCISNLEPHTGMRHKASHGRLKQTLKLVGWWCSPLKHHHNYKCMNTAGYDFLNDTIKLTRRQCHVSLTHRCLRCMCCK